MTALNFYELCARASLAFQIWRMGEQVGEDDQGNRYFKEKKVVEGVRPKRWVVYKGESEPSRVPPMWHAWLHYQTDSLPDPDSPLHQPWEKEHVPNLTGTDAAYRPPGHMLQGGERPRATGDYEPWTPS